MVGSRRVWWVRRQSCTGDTAVVREFTLLGTIRASLIEASSAIWGERNCISSGPVALPSYQSAPEGHQCGSSCDGGGGRSISQWSVAGDIFSIVVVSSSSLLCSMCNHEAGNVDQDECRLIGRIVEAEKATMSDDRWEGMLKRQKCIKQYHR